MALHVEPKELQEIKEHFKEVLEYSQDISNPEIDELFENWMTNKERIWTDFLKGQLIYESAEPLTFTLSAAAKESRFSNFLDEIEHRYGLYNLTEYLEAQEDGFYNNEVVIDYKYGAKKFKAGQKLLKTFKYFIPNEGLCSQLQDEASVLIQDNDITGTFCLSIHPLDFLSVSENNYNWRSCHALDGEYRAGNLSYMGDSSTFICYIKTPNKKVKLPHFPESVPWNDKKWRMLLFIPDRTNISNQNENGFYSEIFAGRQYPRVLDGVLEYIKDCHLNKLKGYNEWMDWSDTYINHFPNPFGEEYGNYWLNHKYYLDTSTGGLLSNSKKFKDASKLHYNDLLYSSCYVPKYSINNMYHFKSKYTIGSQVKCLSCGHNYISDENESGAMLCDKCFENLHDYNYSYCSCCDGRFREDDLTWVQDEHICWNCYENETAECACCGEREFISCMKFIPETNEYYCSDINCQTKYEAVKEKYNEEGNK